MTVDIIIGTAFLLMGVTAAFGIMLFRQSPAELEELSKFLPGVRLFRFGIARAVVAIAGICFAVFGGGLIAGIWTF
jgi:hypothetical protein